MSLSPLPPQLRVDRITEDDPCLVVITMRKWIASCQISRPHESGLLLAVHSLCLKSVFVRMMPPGGGRGVRQIIKLNFKWYSYLPSQPPCLAM